MRCTLSLIIPLFLLVGSSCQPQAPQENEDASPLRVMSYNIRYNNPGDGEHAWPHRASRVASTILFNSADLIGVQEALKEQMDTLLTLLPGYQWIGVGRDDGKEAGEYSAIFYRTDRFEIIDSGTFWLSKNPSIPGSKDWDAALTRIATWGHFKDIQADTSIFHFNTHFDHRGEEAREKSAELIAQRATRQAGQYPLVVTGDFNFTENATGYGAMTSKLTDTFYATATPRHGPDDTIYGGFEVTHEPGRRIDYIFVNEHMDVLQYANLSDNWNGAYSSDHLAVISTIQLKK